MTNINDWNSVTRAVPSNNEWHQDEWRDCYPYMEEDGAYWGLIDVPDSDKIPFMQYAGWQYLIDFGKIPHIMTKNYEQANLPKNWFGA